MANTGSYRWEGKQKIEKSLAHAHLDEIRECEDHGHEFTSEEYDWEFECVKCLVCQRCGYEEII